MKAHVRDYNPAERLPQWWACLPNAFVYTEIDRIMNLRGEK